MAGYPIADGEANTYLLLIYDLLLAPINRQALWMVLVDFSWIVKP